MDKAAEIKVLEMLSSVVLQDATYVEAYSVLYDAAAAPVIRIILRSDIIDDLQLQYDLPKMRVDYWLELRISDIWAAGEDYLYLPTDLADSYYGDYSALLGDPLQLKISVFRLVESLDKCRVLHLSRLFYDLIRVVDLSSQNYSNDQD